MRAVVREVPPPVISRTFAGTPRYGQPQFPAVAFVAKQVKVPSSDLGFYEWSGSTIEYHRNQVRERLGFRVCSVADEDKLTDYCEPLF